MFGFRIRIWLAGNNPRLSKTIINERFGLDTRGDGDLVDITREVAEKLKATKLKKGSVTVFVVGSTAAITTFEYEPGLIRDVQELYAKLVMPQLRRGVQRTCHPRESGDPA